MEGAEKGVGKCTLSVVIYLKNLCGICICFYGLNRCYGWKNLSFCKRDNFIVSLIRFITESVEVGWICRDYLRIVREKFG